MLLPVADLEETLEKYKIWVKPLLSDSEYDDMIKTTDEFKNGAAKKLQNLLKKQMNIYKNTSWLSSAWLNSYLDGRIAPIIGSNFASQIKLPNDDKYSNKEMILNFIYSLGEICRQYKTNNFEKVYDARNNEICLSQFQILKGSSRIPFKNRDIYNISNNNSNYITIFYKNNLFKLEIMDNNNEIMNLNEAIDSILNSAKYKEYSLSTISFTDSDKAYELRSKYYDYNDFFNVLENSLFNISIYDEKIDNENDEFMFYMYLNAENSWVYKPLNFIYNLNNKSLYINCEHTYQDGGTILEILKRAIEYMKTLDLKKNSNKDISSPIVIYEYFDEEYKKEADLIKKDYFNQINNFKIVTLLLEIDDSKLKDISKDALMQFLLQYGQYKSFGTVRGMYEAVDMREYQYGRTECVRSVSCESIDFIKSLDSDSDDIYEKLKIAELEHKNRIKNCKAANGVNRHLYGLYLMIDKLDNADDKEKSNKFFNSIAYKKISENFLSTTSLGYNNYMGYLLFSPVMDKGFGINYYYEPNKGVRFVISYYKDQEDKAYKFFEALKEGCNKIKSIK